MEGDRHHVAGPAREPSRRAWSPGGRLLGLDVGGRRIGIAVSDEHGMIASPVGYVRRGTHERDELYALILRWSPTALIVGLPTGLSGREGPQAADVRGFAKDELARFGLPLHFWDERLTTIIAERALIARGTRREARKEQIDAMAAAVILQDYLDSERARHARGRRASGLRPQGQTDSDA